MFEDPTSTNDNILKSLQSRFALAYLEFMFFNLGKIVLFNLRFQNKILMLHNLEKEVKGF